MTNILIAIGLAIAPFPVVLEPGVHETQFRNFDLPVFMDDDYRKTCGCLRLWVSEDRGKSWKQHEEISAEGTRFSFKAARDGHYWFILQTVAKNGKAEPPIVDKAPPGQKVYVNQAKRAVTRQHFAAKPALPPTPQIDEQANAQQLRRGLEEMRAMVNQLRKRVTELEKNRNPN